MWQPQPDYLLLWMGQSTGPILPLYKADNWTFGWLATGSLN